jgi:hypothetical protein
MGAGTVTKRLDTALWQGWDQSESLINPSAAGQH